MSRTRREILAAALGAGSIPLEAQNQPVRYVRFRAGRTTAYGVLEGETIREIRGDLFGEHRDSGARHKLSSVKLLYPCTPSKVLAVGLNYRSHLGQQKPPSKPELFFKPVTSLTNPGDPIVVPPDANNVHYEGELVIVIGRRAKSIPESQAREVIFGVTCGNDVSERDWQKDDLQWWRAKGTDTFGPLGPAIARGIDYGKLDLQTRLNRQLVQKQNTADLLFDCHKIVSFASRYVTLEPGDVIYTGTPGTTRAMKPGDIVEVEISGIGVLSNPVAAA